APSTPNIHINFAPNMTFSPYQHVSLPSSPTEADTFHNVAEAFSPGDFQHPLRQSEEPPVGIGGKDEILPSRFSSAFPFSGPLTDVDEFYGRVLEKVTLQTRTRNGTSTSIVGPRRIGKTWLMRYLMLTAPKEFGPRLRIGYLDATSPHCATVASFTAKALEELAIVGTNRTAQGLSALEDGVRDLVLQHYLLVLCIDEFEGLSGKQGFDLRFLEQLRAVSQVGLVLVVASKRPLLDVEKAIVNEDLETSPLHNILPQLLLKPFAVEEAKQFVKSKGAQAKFTQEEQSRLLQFGGQLPLRLQLTGRMIEEAKLAAKEDPSHFRPDDPTYWQEFEQRLEETYRTVVRA
ncbi:MAG: AAA family ATPase, partial [Ktedonobacteraceae bacterium]